MTTNASQLVANYESMLTLSRQLLETARRGDWDGLVSMEQARAEIEASLAREDTIAWRAAEGARKGELIRAILAIDSETRSLVEAQMNALQGQISSSDVTRKLKKAYDLP